MLKTHMLINTTVALDEVRKSKHPNWNKQNLSAYLWRWRWFLRFRRPCVVTFSHDQPPKWNSWQIERCRRGKSFRQPRLLVLWLNNQSAVLRTAIWSSNLQNKLHYRQTLLQNNSNGYLPTSRNIATPHTKSKGIAGNLKIMEFLIWLSLQTWLTKQMTCRSNDRCCL